MTGVLLRLNNGAGECLLTQALWPTGPAPIQGPDDLMSPPHHHYLRTVLHSHEGTKNTASFLFPWGYPQLKDVL